MGYPTQKRLLTPLHYWVSCWVTGSKRRLIDYRSTWATSCPDFGVRKGTWQSHSASPSSSDVHLDRGHVWWQVPQSTCFSSQSLLWGGTRPQWLGSGYQTSHRYTPKASETYSATVALINESLADWGNNIVCFCGQQCVTLDEFIEKFQYLAQFTLTAEKALSLMEQCTVHPYCLEKPNVQGVICNCFFNELKLWVC